MNAAVVCLVVVACVLFSQHYFAVASPALRPDQGKRFSDYEFDYEDPDMFKQKSLMNHARYKKVQDMSFPTKLHDDSKPLLLKRYSVPITIDLLNDPERLNRLLGTIRFEEKVPTPEVADESVFDLRSEQQEIINGLTTKKSDNRYVGDAFQAPRGKKSFVEYEDEVF